MYNVMLNYSNNEKNTLFKHASKLKSRQALMPAQKLTQTVPDAKPLTIDASITDRAGDQKAVISAFLMLPLSACDPVDLSKFLAKDKLA